MLNLIICTGEFGIVYRGLLTQTNTMPLPVGVKTLKGFLKHVPISQFLLEVLQLSFLHMLCRWI